MARSSSVDTTATYTRGLASYNTQPSDLRLPRRRRDPERGRSGKRPRGNLELQLLSARGAARTSFGDETSGESTARFTSRESPGSSRARRRFIGGGYGVIHLRPQVANVVALVRVEAALEQIQEVHRPPERGPVDVKVPDGASCKVTRPRRPVPCSSRGRAAARESIHDEIRRARGSRRCSRSTPSVVVHHRKQEAQRHQGIHRRLGLV